MGLEIEKGTRLVSTGGGTFGRRIRTFHREKKKHKKNTKKTLPWKLVGRGGEPRWARERRYRRKAGRLGASELGLERSSVAVPSRKAEGPMVVWVWSVGGELKTLGRVVGVAHVGGERSGCCPLAGVIARQAVEARCPRRELTISRRYRQYEGSARVSGCAQKARRDVF